MYNVTEQSRTGDVDDVSRNEFAGFQSLNAALILT